MEVLQYKSIAYACYGWLINLIGGNITCVVGR